MELQSRKYAVTVKWLNVNALYVLSAKKNVTSKDKVKEEGSLKLEATLEKPSY